MNERHSDQRARSVLVIDDHSVCREGLSALLAGTGLPLRPLKVASPEAALAALVQPPAPDLIVYDWVYRNGAVGGLRGLLALRAAAPAVPLVVLADHVTDEMQDAAARAGAIRTLDKQMDAHALRDTLQRCLLLPRCHAAAHGVAAAPSALPPPSPAAAVRLSPRQRQLLPALARGDSNKTIALALRLSLHTVRAHVSHLLHALGARTRAEAVAIATRLGLI